MMQTFSGSEKYGVNLGVAATTHASCIWLPPLAKMYPYKLRCVVVSRKKCVMKKKNCVMEYETLFFSWQDGFTDPDAGPTADLFPGKKMPLEL
jgi:hypothetical protein